MGAVLTALFAVLAFGYCCGKYCYKPRAVEVPVGEGVPTAQNETPIVQTEQ